MELIVYLNGKYLPISQALISVMDRGFLLADGIYDCIMVYNGKAFHPQKHIDRLRYGLKAIDLDLDLSDSALLKIMAELIKRNGPELSQSFYIQITRGTCEKRGHHYPQPEAKPTIFVKLAPTATKDLRSGIKVITVKDIRWQRCDVKGINRLPNVIMSQQAHSQKAEEAIIIKNGMAVEGASSNIFIVENNVVYTPPLSHDLLGGITREIVTTLCQKHTKINEAPISLERLLQADEAWISSSSRKIAPVTQVDEHVIGDGKPGKVYNIILAAYDKEIENIVSRDD